jgi:hypothetical protein
VQSQREWIKRSSSMGKSRLGLGGETDCRRGRLYTLPRTKKGFGEQLNLASPDEKYVILLIHRRFTHQIHSNIHPGRLANLSILHQQNLVRLKVSSTPLSFVLPLLKPSTGQPAVGFTTVD